MPKSLFLITQGLYNQRTCIRLHHQQLIGVVVVVVVGGDAAFDLTQLAAVVVVVVDLDEVHGDVLVHKGGLHVHCELTGHCGPLGLPWTVVIVQWPFFISVKRSVGNWYWRKVVSC